MKKIFSFSLLFFLCIGTQAYADQASSGLISGQIWYSQNTLAEGDTVSIYTAVWNGDANTLAAHVDFYDNQTILGSRDVSVPANTLKQVSISWKVTSGDHSISAKISSAAYTQDGKEQTVTLENASTDPDHTFVPVSIKKIVGEQAQTTTDVIKDEINKAATAASDALPPQVSSMVASVDATRASTYASIEASKAQTKAQIDAMNKPAAETPASSSKTKSQTKTSSSNTLDATQKPIAYIKLFFLTILGFIFGNPVVFYGLGALLLFLILRFFYRKLKTRKPKKSNKE